MNNDMELQTFKNEEGVIICVKCGWIAVDVPVIMNITEAEIRGTSTRYLEEEPFSYYDIALNGRCILHALRRSFGTISGYNIQPFFFDEYPF